MSFVKFISSGVVIIGLCVIASHSTAQTKTKAARTNDGIDEQLKIILSFYNPDSSLTVADAANTRYNANYSSAVTSEDAGKPTNVDENVAILRDNHRLMVERRPLIDAYDTTFLLIYNMKLRSYRFDIVPIHFTAPLLSAYIHDSYTQLNTPISLLDTTRLSFAISRDTGSYRIDRFTIYFRPAEHFRSNSTGYWNDRATWEMSSDSASWQSADVYPFGAVRSVLVLPPHVVRVSEDLDLEGEVTVLTGAGIVTLAGKSLLIKKCP